MIFQVVFQLRPDEDSGTEIEGHLNIPLSDAFAVRLSWQDRDNDGYSEPL